jgi:AcrR family transcriptional regulator
MTTRAGRLTERSAGNLAIEGSGWADWRDYTGLRLPVVLDAALQCFIEAGYHGTSIRAVAARANLSVPGLYHYYSAKQALLVEINRFALGDLWDRCCAALDEAGDDVVRQVELLVECQVLFHAHNQALAFIASTEIRALEGEARTSHIAQRDRLQRLMDGVIHRGAAEAVFQAPYPDDISRAIITMCTSVAQWYRPNGLLSPSELAERYKFFARMALGVN